MSWGRMIHSSQIYIGCRLRGTRQEKLWDRRAVNREGISQLLNSGGTCLWTQNFAFGKLRQEHIWAPYKSGLKCKKLSQNNKNKCLKFIWKTDRRFLGSTTEITSQVFNIYSGICNYILLVCSKTASLSSPVPLSSAVGISEFFICNNTKGEGTEGQGNYLSGWI